MSKLNYNIVSFLLVVFCSAGLNVSAQTPIDEAIQKYNSGSISYISVNELKTELEQGKELVMLDTRSKEEFEVSHLQNAYWIGYKSFDDKNVNDFDKNSVIIVYCSVGVRSEKIGEKLTEIGFQNIRNLYGGIFKWVNEGNPVFKSGEPTQNIHTYNNRWEKYIEQGIKVN